MAFVKTTWNDDALPDMTAAQLNRQEQGIADAHAWIADPWHYVGTAGEPQFIAPWVNYGASFEKAAFRFILPGVVVFKGTVKSGNYSSLIFTLPASHRPLAERRLTVNCHDGATRRVALLYVNAAGGVYAYSETGVASPVAEFDMEAIMAI